MICARRSYKEAFRIISSSSFLIADHVLFIAFNLWLKSLTFTFYHQIRISCLELTKNKKAGYN
ncbi:hypothetical protein BpHYR1_049225 [Brachionus plicatilis]|uniref:Uncharacterized protein n=1 Tax=Brachionus plicatilis TaxID=10195 RepID=A0A3M7RXA1_BRAPC|nr:hypothetical protein BpHYR1_049225 [Brachionus plicatilis]